MSGILFIDAELPFAEQMSRALQSRGLSVKILDDGKDGLDYARDHKPDLIVLCVELPKMSGYSICNKLKKDNDLKGIPLLITSKEATPETFAQHKKLKTRAEEYLIKPFSEADLMDKVGALIALPAAGAASAVAPASDYESLGDLGDDLELPTASRAAEDEIQLDEGDDLQLDGGGAPSGASVGISVGLDEDSLLAGLEDFSKDLDVSPPPQPKTGSNASKLAARLNPSLDDDLELGGSVQDDEVPNFDSAFEAAVEPARVESKPASSTVSSTVPRSSTPSPSSAVADMQALQASRRETSELKAKVGELEARLRAAEEAARAAQQSMPPTASSASSAREVLSLRQQLRAKDDEILGKEQQLVELQEQIERTHLETHHKLSEVTAKEVEISSLKARVEALAEERDGLEQQVQSRVQEIEAERDGLRAELDDARNDAQRLRADLDDQKRAKSTVDGRIKQLEAEVREQEQNAMTAYQRLKTEEQLRDKARQALDIAQKLLKGDVDMKGSKEIGIDAE